MGLTQGKECPYCGRVFGVKTLDYHIKSCARKQEVVDTSKSNQSPLKSMGAEGAGRGAKEMSSPKKSSAQANTAIGAKKFSFGPTSPVHDKPDEKAAHGSAQDTAS